MQPLNNTHSPHTTPIQQSSDPSNGFVIKGKTATKIIYSGEKEFKLTLYLTRKEQKDPIALQKRLKFFDEKNTKAFSDFSNTLGLSRTSTNQGQIKKLRIYQNGSGHLKDVKKYYESGFSKKVKANYYAEKRAYTDPKTQKTRYDSVSKKYESFNHIISLWDNTFSKQAIKSAYNQQKAKAEEAAQKKRAEGVRQPPKNQVEEAVNEAEDDLYLDPEDPINEENPILTEEIDEEMSGEEISEEEI